MNNLNILYNCISCNKQVRNELYGTSFLPNLLTIISGFLVLILIVLLFVYLSNKKFKKHSLLFPAQGILNPVPLSTASVIIGIGLGGFVDGILFHQILQLHGMISNKLSILTYVGKAVNMFWDGIFHTTTFLAVLIGIILLVKQLKRKDINPSPKLAMGGALSGWGIFNIVEGIIHHHILDLHNVNEFTLNTDIWNYSFLLSGFIFLFIGLRIIYSRAHYPSRLQ